MFICQKMLKNISKIEMKNNQWYKKILLDNVKKIVSSATTYIVFALVFLVWHFILGIKFQWQDIVPLSQPTIFIRAFYSAFVFVTLGRLLYFIHFYEVLSDILAEQFKLYISIKSIIWMVLMYVSYQYIIPWIFSILNTGISVLFNLANLILYIIPLVGISIILTMIYFFIKSKLEDKNKN